LEAKGMIDKPSGAGESESAGEEPAE
jgi:hypothetical protein